MSVGIPAVVLYVAVLKYTIVNHRLFNCNNVWPWWTSRCTTLPLNHNIMLAKLTKKRSWLLYCILTVLTLIMLLCLENIIAHQKTDGHTLPFLLRGRMTRLLALLCVVLSRLWRETKIIIKMITTDDAPLLTVLNHTTSKQSSTPGQPVKTSRRLNVYNSSSRQPWICTSDWLGGVPTVPLLRASHPSPPSRWSDLGPTDIYLYTI